MKLQKFSGVWLIILMAAPFVSAQLSVRNSANATLMRVTQQGYVGIGGITPTVLLQVKPVTDPAAGSPLLLVESSAGADRLRVDHDGAVSTTNVLQVNSSGDSYVLGDVGIGTTTPEGKLSVSATSLSSYPFLAHAFNIYSGVDVRANISQTNYTGHLGIASWLPYMSTTGSDGFRIAVHAGLRNPAGTEWIVAAGLGYQWNEPDRISAVDGAVHPTATLPSATIKTTAGNFWNARSGANDYVLIASGLKSRFDCEIGVFTDPDAATLAVNGNARLKTYAIYATGAKSVLMHPLAINTEPEGTHMLTVNGSAAKNVGGNTWATYSDGRYKIIEGSFNRGLEAIEQLNVIRYHYSPDNPFKGNSSISAVGLVAQEVERVIPEAVEKNDDGVLMLNSDAIIWSMLNAIKELKAEVETLKAAK